jgi:hypothetical protein
VKLKIYYLLIETNIISKFVNIYDLKKSKNLTNDSYLLGGTSFKSKFKVLKDARH